MSNRATMIKIYRRQAYLPLNFLKTLYRTKSIQQLRRKIQRGSLISAPVLEVQREIIKVEPITLMILLKCAKVSLQLEKVLNKEAILGP